MHSILNRLFTQQYLTQSLEISTFSDVKFCKFVRANLEFFEFLLNRDEVVCCKFQQCCPARGRGCWSLNLCKDKVLVYRFSVLNWLEAVRTRMSLLDKGKDPLRQVFLILVQGLSNVPGLGGLPVHCVPLSSCNGEVMTEYCNC